MAEVEYRCFVGGLSWGTDDRSLGEAFNKFGEVTDSKIINDRETGRSRGFGFVTFADEQSMRDAIEQMNGRELDGRTITVNEAQSRGSGGGGGGRGYGGGGGGRGYNSGGSG
ncbi:RNA-binding protein, partial [Mycobacterium kansasii]